MNMNFHLHTCSRCQGSMAYILSMDLVEYFRVPVLKRWQNLTHTARSTQG